MITCKVKAALVAAVGVLALCTACSSNKPQPVVTVTVPPSNPPAASKSAPSGSGTAAGSTSASGTASAANRISLGGTCDTLLSDFDIAAAIGKTSIPGNDAFVVGMPETDIGRRSYLNCQYGVTGTGAAAKAGIEIGISLYSSPELATQRVSATVQDYTTHGAQAAPVTVSGQPAQVLTGGVGSGYTDALLVVADGQRTVAVTLDPSIASGSAITTDAVKLAALTLKQTDA